MISALVISIAALAAGPANVDRSRDSDGDGVSDADEDPNGNGVVDPGESDPRDVDTDHDNVADDVERRMGTAPDDGADVPPIPEPLFADLVRNLGSRRGEMEANVVASSSFRRSSGIQWGPEIEYAPVKGLGFELEAPFTNDSLQALKVGSQVTLASFLGRHLELGAIGSYARRVSERGLDAFAGLVTGVRFDARMQGILLAGATGSRADGRSSFGAAVNPSFFFQLSRVWTVGLEVGHRFEAEPKTYALPQVHLNPSKVLALKLQVGAGVDRAGGSLAPLVAVRVGLER